MSSFSHGPWVDVHAHPGRCFLGGLPATSPFVQFLGPEDAIASIRSASNGELSVVNASTVADLAVIGPNSSGGLGTIREFEPGEAAADHARQLEVMNSQLVEGGIRLVLHPSDIEAAPEAGPGVFLSCEGADFLDGSAGGLDDAYDRGVRSVTLVHYRVNELGDIQTEEAKHGGLTVFGREIVREMNSMGMIVDLAHATFEATAHALEESSKPIMISHSHLASTGAEHPRLLSERHAKMVAEAGGVIGAWPAGFAQESLADYCDEICRLVEIIGVDHVAIGTDLDANYKPVLTSYKQFPQLAAGLEELGMSSEEVDQVLGGNFVRLFDEVCQVAD